MAVGTVTPCLAQDEEQGKFFTVHADSLPEVITRVEPQYPDSARAWGVTGTVVIEVRVGKDGRVRATSVVKSIPMLDRAATAAIRQWVFRPATDNGRPVALWIPVSIAFPSSAREPGGPGGSALGLVFETGDGVRVDTFRGLFTKDLVGHTDTTIALSLTPAELDSILRRVKEVRLLELPELLAPEGCGEWPRTSLRLLVRAEGKERQFDWWNWWECSASIRESETYKGLNQVIRLITGIVEAKAEYKTLPRPRGAYL
jgi:protein TonB